MAFDWRDYLTLAAQLAAQTNNEAALRSPVSRAYYAAYGTTRDVSLGHNVVSLGIADTHEAFWSYLRSQQEIHLKQIGIDGDRLRRDRVAADYRGTITIGPEAAQLAIDRAYQILSDLDQVRWTS